MRKPPTIAAPVEAYGRVYPLCRHCGLEINRATGGEGVIWLHLDHYVTCTGSRVLAFNVSNRRGTFGGFCATPDCPRESRFISIHESKLEESKRVYRCQTCCDDIDAKAQEAIEASMQILATKEGMNSDG